MEDLTAEEYFDLRNLYIDSPWGPYEDARRWFCSTPFKKGTKFDDVRGYSKSNKQDGDDVQAIVDAVNTIEGNAESSADFFQRENERLKNG